MRTTFEWFMLVCSSSSTLGARFRMPLRNAVLDRMITRFWDTAIVWSVGGWGACCVESLPNNLCVWIVCTPHPGSLFSFPCPQSSIFTLVLLIRASSDNGYYLVQSFLLTVESGLGEYECQHQQLHGGEKGEHRRSALHGNEGKLNF